MKPLSQTSPLNDSPSSFSPSNNSFYHINIPSTLLNSTIYGGGDAAVEFNPSQMELNSHKKLRKLPHVFGKVLELPFRSDADVAVEEGPDFFRFVVKIKVEGGAAVGDVRAHAVEIHPGVIKIVVRNDRKLIGAGVELFLDKLHIDTWRFRLPSTTLPELATAAFVDGKLVVTVPKGGGGGSRRESVRGGDNRVLPNVYLFPSLPQNLNRYKMEFA